MGILSRVLDPIFGADTSQEDQAAAEAMQRALKEYENLEAPDLRTPEYENLSYVGDFTPTTITTPQISAGEDVEYQSVDPRLAAFSEMGGTAFDQVAIDPRLKDEQYQSLAALDEIIQGGGLSAADRANLNRVQNEAAQADRGRREAILQNMQARGMGGSGMELLAQLQSSQAATDRANQSGLDIAGLAQQRALDAIMQSGQLAGDIRSQDFGEQAQLAAARDAINQFNTSNRNQMNQFNTAAANQMSLANAQNRLGADQYNRNMGMDAQKFNAQQQMTGQQFNANAANQAGLRNLDTRQQISNQNVGIRNAGRDQRNQLKQQNFQNQLGIAQGKAGANTQQANYQTGLADRKAQKEAGYMNALIQGGAAIYGAGAKKKDDDL